MLLTGDPIFGEVFVQMTPTMATVFPDVPMLVYYDGVMTMSLPGKVNARYVVVPEVTGVVSEKDGAGFTLTDADGNTYRILTSDALLVGQLAMNEEEPLPGSPEAEALAAEGTEVVVDEALATEEVAEEAENTVTEAEEATDETTEVSEPVEPAAEEAAAEPNSEEAEEAPAGLLHDEVIAAQPEGALIQWGDGDTVTVYHQGPMDAVSGAELIALGMLVHR